MFVFGSVIAGKDDPLTGKGGCPLRLRVFGAPTRRRDQASTYGQIRDHKELEMNFRTFRFLWMVFTPTSYLPAVYWRVTSDAYCDSGLVQL